MRRTALRCINNMIQFSPNDNYDLVPGDSVTSSVFSTNLVKVNSYSRYGSTEHVSDPPYPSLNHDSVCDTDRKGIFS